MSPQRELISILSGMILMLIGTIGLALFVTSGPVLYLSFAFFAIGFGTGLFNNPLIQRAIAAATSSTRSASAIELSVLSMAGNAAATAPGALS